MFENCKIGDIAYVVHRNQKLNRWNVYLTKVDNIREQKCINSNDIMRIVDCKNVSGTIHTVTRSCDMFKTEDGARNATLTRNIINR
jgi:hypothetical protein